MKNKTTAWNWGQVYFRFDFWKKDSKNRLLLFCLLFLHSFQKDRSVSSTIVKIASIRCKIKNKKLMFYSWPNFPYTFIFSYILIFFLAYGKKIEKVSSTRSFFSILSCQMTKQQILTNFTYVCVISLSFFFFFETGFNWAA